MPTDNAAAWDRYAETYQAEAQLPTSTAHYGPDVATESELRLIGELRGKKVIELGCGGAQNAIAFARQGATAIGVDISAAQLAYARRLCAAEEVRVELRQGDMAELPYLRADSIDLVFSSWAFQFVEDLNRVFRQVHRVLKVGAPFVFSLPHPAYRLIDAGPQDGEPEDGPDTDAAATGRSAARRRSAATGRSGPPSYFDRSPIVYQIGDASFTAYPHTLADLYTGLARASCRVDLVLEPEPVRGAPRGFLWRDAMERFPRTLIVRARKEGH